MYPLSAAKMQGRPLSTGEATVVAYSRGAAQEKAIGTAAAAQGEKLDWRALPRRSLPTPISRLLDSLFAEWNIPLEHRDDIRSLLEAANYIAAFSSCHWWAIGRGKEPAYDVPELFVEGLGMSAVESVKLDDGTVITDRGILDNLKYRHTGELFGLDLITFKRRAPGDEDATLALRVVEELDRMVYRLRQ